VKLSRVVDRWLGELARSGHSESTLDAYRRHLNKLIDQLERHRPDIDAREVTTDDCRTFLDGWLRVSDKTGKPIAPATICNVYSALSGLFKWLYLEGEVDENPMLRIRRPRKPRPGEAETVIVSLADVERMFAAAADWQEFLCISVLAYLGARRNAVSCLRWRDVDLDEGSVRLREKGRKVVDVPMPDELVEILRSAVEGQHVSSRPDDYVVPNRRPASVRRAERSNKVIWETVVRVAERAGVRATAHALRRAFAVAFLTNNPGALEALQALMNHRRIDTTQVYLKALNRAKAMESVRTLSWGGAGHFVFPPQEEAARKKPPPSRGFAEEAHTGFEPVPPP
jgi:integrase/recombinase XerD